MNEEQKAFNAMIESYITYEMGCMSKEQEARFEEIDVIEHAQGLIAKSLISSIIGDTIKENPEIDMDDAHNLVFEQIKGNMEFGFCEVFKDGN